MCAFRIQSYPRFGSVGLGLGLGVGLFGSSRTELEEVTSWIPRGGIYIYIYVDPFSTTRPISRVNTPVNPSSRVWNMRPDP